ncbi:MAG: peptide chain release factor-like protein [Planctomycetaceae bacterium]|nr:peptide chain release factor-like protein [Planctomycetaceae bacterium]
MPDETLHPAALSKRELLTQCESRRQRRSGPGGQHRNKVETAVVFTHTPTGIQGEASERRSQEQNRKVALFRLRVNLAIGSRRTIDLAKQEPSELWQARCKNRRIAVNSEHDDFPAVLAEALDVLAACGWDAKEATEFLAFSASQLTKLLQAEPRAFTELNRQREARGLSRLR